MPVARGFSGAYFSFAMISAVSRPVFMSGASAFTPFASPSAFHTESSGKGRSLMLMKACLRSLEISFFASSGLSARRFSISASPASSVGISSGTICVISMPSSVPSMYSKSTIEVALPSEYERLSRSSFESSRKSFRLSGVKMEWSLSTSTPTK